MENYDLFGDDLGSGMLEGLADLGANNGSFNSSNQPTGVGNMMQSYNNQQPQYTQIGQGMAPPSKMASSGYPDYSNQYGQYNSSASQQPGLGGYTPSSPAPTRPMAGYPYPHQPTASPSMHYQDYSVQSQSGMMRPAAPTQPHAPPPRMVTPTPQQPQQQQFGAYSRPPSQESMYLQQFPRWNEQQTAVSPYGASSLPHHYPTNANSGYRAPAPPPHSYAANLPRPPQQQAGPPPQSGQSTQQQQPPPPSASLNSQQHSIPYMTRPQTPSNVMPQNSQSQYGQSMYPNSSNQYPNYHHSSSSVVGQLASGVGGPVVGATSSGPPYSHHTQQQYSLPTPTQQHQYGNQYGQYYPGSGAQQMSSQPSVPTPLTPGTNQMSYPGSYPTSVPNINSPVPNGSPSYRPGYAQLPQLSPRQPTPSPRQPTPSPRPPSSTTPTIPSASAQPTMSQSQQQQQQQGMSQQSSQPPPPQIQQQQQQLSQQPSSLQQLEQMVMPHVNKNSPNSPKPHSNMASGVLSPMGGPKTPMSPGMSGPKTPMPMSPSQWQQPAANSRPPAPPIATKPSYLHPSQQVPNSPSNYGMSNNSSSISNVDNTINSVVRSSHESADLELSGLSATLDTSAPDASLSSSNSVKVEDSIKPSTPVPPPPTQQQQQSSNNSMSNSNELSSSSMVSLADDGTSNNNSSKDNNNQSQISSSSAPVEEQQQQLLTNSLINSMSNSTSNNNSESLNNEGEKPGALTSLSSPVENSHTSISQYNSSPSADSNHSVNAVNNSNVMNSSPTTSLSASSVAPNMSSLKQEMTPQYSSSPSSMMNSSGGVNGTLNDNSQSQQQQMGVQNNNQSQLMGSNNIMSGYGSGPSQQQQGLPYGNSMGSPQSSGMKPMMPPPPSPHQYPPNPRFSSPDPNGPQPPYMNNYHSGSGMYPGSPYGPPQSNVLPGQMRPHGPPQYPVNSMGPQGMQVPGPNPAAERYNYEMHQIQQQLQHLYSLPPNPQTQLQINELQERLRSLQQQAQAMPGSQYPMQSPMGGIPSGPGGFGPMTMPQGMPGMDIPENGPPKPKKKKERKPRGEGKAKGKKGKANKDHNLDDSMMELNSQPPQLPHEVYEFQDIPPEMPEKKQKKPRKPREQKSPKAKKAKEPKPPKEKTPKRTRKKKSVENDIQENLNSSFPIGDSMDGEMGIPKIEDNSESDQKNGIGAAGIIAAEGGSSAPISGGEGDTSTQETTTTIEAASDTTLAVENTELVTPEKPKKPKKPKLKSNSTGKKRPSKTLLAFRNRKKRKRSDSEASDIERTPPPSPPLEDDSNKRRSGRNTKRKKYIDDIDLALSDEDLLIPNKTHMNKAIEASVISANAEAAAAAGDSAEVPVPVDGQPESVENATTDSTIVPSTPPKKPSTPIPKEKSKPVEETPNLNKHNFFYVNTLEEDTMVVQHILSVRMGKREIIQDSSDEEDEVTDDKKVTDEDSTKSKIDEQAVKSPTSKDNEEEKEKTELCSTEPTESKTDTNAEKKSDNDPPPVVLTEEDSKTKSSEDNTETLSSDKPLSPKNSELVESMNNDAEKITEKDIVQEDTINKEPVLIDPSLEKKEIVSETLNSNVVQEEKEENVNKDDKKESDKTEETKSETVSEEKMDTETKENEPEILKPNLDLKKNESEKMDVESENDIKEDDKKVDESEKVISEVDKDQLTTTDESKKDKPSEENIEDSSEKVKDEADPDVEGQTKKVKKIREPQTIEVEEFYVKYKSFSYLHCEWKTEEELMKGDKRVNQKIKRFKQKLSNNANIFEFIEEEPFNPDFIEVDRVLDMSEATEPTSGKVTRNFLVKWRSLPYDESTWELEDDIDPEKLALFHKFHKCPKKDQWKKRPRPKAADWKKLDESPVYKNGNTLREYQLEGLNWLSFSWFNGRNCILADEMGLGKTIQSLTFVESIYRCGIRGPFLVIAPLSTVPNWCREFENWTDLNIVVYHGSVASRNMIHEYELFYRHPDNPQMNLKDCYKFNVLITTFEIILTDVMELKDFPWRACVIDEAHRLKNKNCKLLEGLRLLNLDHRVLLSGTPLQNNVQELFSLLNFLEPSQFSSDENFVKEFGDLKSDTQVQKLQALLKPMMLRRLKEDVEKSIAPKEETIVEVELTNMQKKYYRAILERNFSFLSKGTSSANIPNLMNTMMELRKCCIHPYLLNGAEEQIQLDYRINYSLPESDPDLYYKALVHSSGKMVLVDKLLPKLKANGHRVLIFSQMVRCLDILEDYLIYRQYPFERIDGRIRGPVRQAAIDRFSKPDSDRFVFLLCTKAGGLGINLTAADTVIIYDSDWNPQNDLQAQARCHRIGQSKKVKIYRLICRNTYEREMFDRASLKLGLDKAVLQSMNTTQGGKIDPNAQASKQLTKKEVEDLLKRGAYGALMDEDNAGEKFCEEDIDFILERRTQIITLESGEKGSTFSKASFAATGIREDINIDDPDFWKKWAKKAELDMDEGGEKNDLLMNEPRRRTQIKRYGHDEGVMDISELESSTDSDEEGNVGDRTRSGRSGRKTRSGKSGKRGRRGNLDDDFQCDDGIVEYGRWSKSECYKIERGLLTYGWKRWNKILGQGQFRNGWNEQHMEDCARLILLHCVNNFRGDEKVKSFVADLICPLENAAITRNHSGLANPVSRGGRKSKKKDKPLKMEPSPENEDWMKDVRYDSDINLDPTYSKHLSKNANKVLLRIRMLYYIKQEIIGSSAQKIDDETPITELDICPSSLALDGGPVDWWDRDADASLLVGTYKHGYERYNIMRQDTVLCFLSRCGPPDGSAVLAEISSEVNIEELDKDVGGEEEDEESNMEAKETNGEKTPAPVTEPTSSKEDTEDAPDTTTSTDDTEEAKADKPEGTATEDKPDEESAEAKPEEETVEGAAASDVPVVESVEAEPGKPLWPSTTDLNTRIRKLITAFQRHFKKEEIKNVQKAKRLERKEKIEQIVRERERQKMEVHQKRWSKKEESDFYRTVSTFGVQRIEGNKYDWTKFRAISRLDKKFDETLTEYYRAFYAMCKRICGQKLSEEEDLIQVPVDPLPEDRARRTLERIDLLNKVREEIIHNEKLEERLKLSLPSLDMPEWWIPGKHDKDLLFGAARHGLGRTDLFYLNDPELSFREILRRHIAGEPLLDPAEKLAYRNGIDKKVKTDSEPPPLKRIKPDMVDIEIEDMNTERTEAKRKKEAAAEEALLLQKEKAASDEVIEKESKENDKPVENESKENNENSEADTAEKTTTLGDEKVEEGIEKSKSPVVKTEKTDDDNDVEMNKTTTDKSTADEESHKISSSDNVVVIKQEPKDVDETETEKTDKEVTSKSSEDEPMETEEVSSSKEAPTQEKIPSTDSDNSNISKIIFDKEGVRTNIIEEDKCISSEKLSENKKIEKEMMKQEEKEKIRNEEDESKGSSTEMNEVQVEIKNELKITIKLSAEKMNRVEVQVKGSPKFSVPELPPPSTQEKEEPIAPSKMAFPKFDPFLSSDSNNIEALGNLLNQMNPIRWPRDRAIQIRLEHIVHAIEKNEWPVSRFFSSAAMTETFDYTPQGTPDAATPVRDTPTPISECSDLAPAEDLIMSLPPPNTGTTTTPSPVVTTTTPTPGTNKRGRRRRIAIDVETERAKLQALLNQSMHGATVIPHIPTPSTRLNTPLRRERTSTPSSAGLNLSQDADTEPEGRVKISPAVQKQLAKFQPPPPAHQNHSHSSSQGSLLRSSHQQQVQQQHQQQQQSHRSQSPARRSSPGFSTQAQSSSLDLSIKSSHKDVAAAAMSALSSLSSVTVTPVTLPSPSPKHSSSRDNGSGGLTISSSPMDLSGGVSKRQRESSSLERSFPQEAPLNFGSSGGTKKVSKLENMLDRLKKRKMVETGDTADSSPVGKDKKKKKLDEIVFGLSAAKGSSVFSPPITSEKQKSSQGHSSSGATNLHQSSSGRNAQSSARSGTPSPHVSSSQSQQQSQSAKDAQAFAQNFLSNPLLSALSMFNTKDLKDFSRFAAANAANLSTSNKKESLRTSGNTPSPGASQQPEMPKCDLGRLAEIAVPKFDLFSHDAKVNKWLAEHANMTPERPPSPEFVDRRRRRPRADPLMLDWNKLSGEENVPVIHRVSGKKITGPKAPQLKHLAQWLLENQNYDVDPRWAELVKERGNLPTDLQKRLSGEKKKGPGRPPTLTSPPPSTPNQKSNANVSAPSPSNNANNAFSNLGAFSSLPGLAGINPNLLASFGALDPKNPLFMPFGGLGSLGNLSQLSNLANLGSLGGMGNLGLPNSLFGLGSPFMGFGSEMPGIPSSGGGGGADKNSGSKDNNSHSSNPNNRNQSSSSSSKKEEKNKKSSAAAAAAASQNLLSNSLPFLFPNPGLMYNPLGLGSFPLGSGMSGSPFGNLGQGQMMNGLGTETSGNSSSGKKNANNSSSKNNNPQSNPLAAAALAGLNIPSLSKKDLKDLAAMSMNSHNSTRNERSKSHASHEPPVQAPVQASMMSHSANMEDSDDESLKSLMGNHQDDLPDDDVPSENAERIVLKESKELEKEMAQQKMETRREKRLRDREDASRGGLTSAERQLLMERKKERLAKEDIPRDSGRTTRRSAAAASRSRLEDAVNKMREATEGQEDFPDKD